MSPYEVLKEWKLINWSSLYLGYAQGWVSNAEVADYAAQHTSSSRGDPAVADMAAGRVHNADDMLCLLFRLIKNPNVVAEVDDWRFAFLQCIKTSDATLADQLAQLEEVYERFSHPADMRACLRSADAPAVRLAAMDALMETLKTKLLT